MVNFRMGGAEIWGLDEFVSFLEENEAEISSLPQQLLKRTIEN